MSDSSNIDDELLSAYLDNELAPEERARVEARLAADPAARQLLEELRSVSHAVKSLPMQPLGGDIRDTVLRRAERAMLAGERASARGPSLNDTSPRFTIGRSLRGWVWAGLATAAALAIMAFESNSNRDAQLPNAVAQRNAEPADDAKPAPELRAIVKSAAKSEKLAAPSPPIASPPPESPATPQLSAGSSVLADGKSAPRDAHERSADDSRYAVATARKPNRAEPPIAADKQAPGSVAESRADVTSIRATFNASAATAENVDNDLLVVHLQVKSDAFAGRAFDRMLARNGIAVEESPDQSTATPLAANETEAAAKSTPESPPPTSVPGAQAGDLAANNRAPQLDEALSPNAPAANTDLVFVEAPKQQIESCLAEIQKDDGTYLGVAVDEQQALQKKADGADASQANWRQYSRGVVPQQQTLGRSANNEYFVQTEQGAVAINRGLNGGSGAQQTTEQLERREENNNLAQQHGRAIRMSQNQYQDNVADRLGGGAARFASMPVTLHNQLPAPLATTPAAQKTKTYPQQQAAPPADDTLQVLFILNSDQQPAEVPAAAHVK